MATANPRPTKRLRPSRACGRCRRRKIRCDLRYPSCGACTAAESACFGDSKDGAEKPRSLVRHLEQQVASLEIELTALKEQTSNAHDEIHSAVEQWAFRLASAIAEPRGRASDHRHLFSLTSKFFLSDSSLPAFYPDDRGSNDVGIPHPETWKPIIVSSMPRHIVDAMLEHYCRIYRAQYPSVDEKDVYTARDRFYEMPNLVGYDAFVVHITLAISSNTLAYSDEKRAAATTYGLWTTAKGHLDLHQTFDSWQRLQALQLLTHYGFLNPQHVNVGHCAAAAARLALQLGLHEELPFIDQARLNSAILNSRRRMFWNAYAIDAASHSVRVLPFQWTRGEITAMLPDSESRAIPTQSAHMWHLREIECDIVMGLYHPSSHGESPNPARTKDGWLRSMEERLETWRQTVRQNVNLLERIEFHEVLVQLQLLRLRRPSPRYPKPSASMRKKALNASISLIREYSIQDCLGKMFMLWYAAHSVTEAGVYLLSSIVEDLGSEPQSADRQHICGEDAKILSKHTRSLADLIGKMSVRWPAFRRHGYTITTMCSAVLSLLQRWSCGDAILLSDLESLRFELGGMGTTSAAALSTEHLESSLPDPAPYFSSSMFTPGHSQTSDVVDAERRKNMSNSSTSCAAVLRTEIEGMSSPDLPELHNLYAADSTNSMAWDFLGVDPEEIFAIMLDEDSVLASSSA